MSPLELVNEVLVSALRILRQSLALVFILSVCLLKVICLSKISPSKIGAVLYEIRVLLG